MTSTYLIKILLSALLLFTLPIYIQSPRLFLSVYNHNPQILLLYFDMRDNGTVITLTVKTKDLF